MFSTLSHKLVEGIHLVKKTPLKRKPMNRKRSPASQTRADEANKELEAYRGSFSEYICEVDEFIKKEPIVRSRIATQIDAHWMNKAMQLHHIFGRGRLEEYHWHCCLVQAQKACHDAGHDYSPYSLEICSLMAKIKRHEKDDDLKLIGLIPKVTPPNRLHWNIEAMNKVCKSSTGSPTLTNRIEGILLPSLAGTAYESMCHFVLQYIQETGDRLEV